MFFFGGSKSKKQPAKTAVRAGAARTPQKRTAYRAQVEFPVTFAYAGKPEPDGEPRAAVANDLSAGGLRLVGIEDFVRDTVVDLTFTLPSDFLADFKIAKEVEDVTPFGPRKTVVEEPPPAFAQMNVRARVVAPFFNVRRRKFAHGVAFLDVPETISEEIARFIHFWQLSLLRRRGEE